MATDDIDFMRDVVKRNKRSCNSEEGIRYNGAPLLYRLIDFKKVDDYTNVVFLQCLRRFNSVFQGFVAFACKFSVMEAPPHPKKGVDLLSRFCFVLMFLILLTRPNNSVILC